MSDSDTKSLNVVIGGINIPVKVSDSETDQIHEIAATVNSRLKDIQMRYPEKKLEESLAMTVLSLLVQKETETQTLPHQEELMESFDRVDEILDKLLQ